MQLNEYFKHFQPATPATADTFMTTAQLLYKINQFTPTDPDILKSYLVNNGYEQTLIAGVPHWVMVEVSGE